MGNKNSSISPEQKYDYNKKILYNDLQKLNKTKMKIKPPHKDLKQKLTPEDVMKYKKYKDELQQINKKIEKVQRAFCYHLK